MLILSISSVLVLLVASFAAGYITKAWRARKAHKEAA